MITIEAGDGDAQPGRVIDGVASSPVVLNVPVRAPKGMAWLKTTVQVAMSWSFAPSCSLTPRHAWRPSTGWVELPDADADGRGRLADGRGLAQAGDPITIEQTLAGGAPRSGSVCVDAASSDGVA